MSGLIFKYYYYIHQISGLSIYSSLYTLLYKHIFHFSLQMYILRSTREGTCIFVHRCASPHQHSVSVLGISWNTTRDTFSFKVEPTPHLECLTKRELLGEIARIYDPCGWLTPLTIVTKILMQRLWQTGTEWDDPVSKELLEHWISHRTSYEHLQQFEISRRVGNILDNQQG